MANCLKQNYLNEIKFAYEPIFRQLRNKFSEAGCSC